MTNHYTIEICTDYSPELAAGIGRLGPQLDPSFSDEPVPESRLRRIIESPEHDQLIALNNDVLIVGVATMTVVLGGLFGERGQLEDFVVDEDVRGGPVASMLWSAMGAWCSLKGLKDWYLQTETDRGSAMRFYEKNATILGESVTFKGEVS